jgi:hypothetical protein
LALDLRMFAGFDQQPIECRLRIVPFAPLPCLRTLCAYAHRSPCRRDFDGVGRCSIWTFQQRNFQEEQSN